MGLRPVGDHRAGRGALRQPGCAWCRPAHGEWLAAHVPNAKVVVNHDQGHMPTPEHAHRHAALLRQRRLSLRLVDARSACDGPCVSGADRPDRTNSLRLLCSAAHSQQSRSAAHSQQSRSVANTRQSRSVANVQQSKVFVEQRWSRRRWAACMTRPPKAPGTGTRCPIHPTY